MAGRKQRGRGRGRGNRGRTTDRGRGSGRGGRGRGRGHWSQDNVARHETDTDSAFDDFNFRPRDRRNIPREYAGQVTRIGDSSNNPRYQSNQTRVQGSKISSPRGSRYGRGRWGGRITPDSSSQKERIQMRQFESKLRYGTESLSQLLYEDRPLLKPISFVRSKLNPTLFLKEEEIFKPVAEDAGEQETSHVPTAERLFRIFHGDGVINSSQSPSDVEELLEIDFTDLGRIMDEVEGLGAAAVPSKKTAGMSAKNAEDQVGIATVAERLKGFCIDTKPPPLRPSHLPIDTDSGEYPVTRAALGEEMDEDDEIIVYDAPLPRNGKLAPCQIQSSSTAAAAAAASLPPTADSGPISIHRATHSPPYIAISPPEPVLQCNPAPSPTPTPPLNCGDASSSALSRSPKPATYARGPRHISSSRMNRYATFGSFGAIRAEIALRKVDPRVDEQRRGDSDVDWGGSTSEDSADDEGMLVDQDIDTHAMEAFVKGMSTSGVVHAGVDDLEDEERFHAEHDEKSDAESRVESDDSASDTELELAGDVRDILISVDESESEFALGNALVDEDEPESTSDEEETPKRSFQARLERLRKRTKGRPIQDILEDELGQDLETDEEDSIIAKIRDFLDENDEILRTQDRKQRNRIFRAIHQGDFDIEIDFDGSSARRRKDKFIPEELRDQWERDRAKKAERKHLRELERHAAAVDPFRTQKGGKKARKAKLAAALATPVSLEAIVGYMKRFVADTGGARTLPLPPMNRQMRKLVHELACAFNIESKSKGNGDERFTTLKKTTLSGVNVDEKKIARILRKSSTFLPYVTKEGGKGKGKGKGKGAAGKTRPRDGDVVGEMAPKIDGSNIGFQMLSAMGWEEGGRIGVDGGLEAPLVAVIKTTKLGLGASKG